MVRLSIPDRGTNDHPESKLHPSLTLKIPAQDSGPVLPPVAAKEDCLGLWDAANGKKSDQLPQSLHLDCRHKSVQTRHWQATRPGVEIELLDNKGMPFYRAKAAEQAWAEQENQTVQLSVSRCNADEGGTFPVTLLNCRLPSSEISAAASAGNCQEICSIFPHIAAMTAIKAAADSLQARQIAQFDPDASSPQAARLAFDALATARQGHEWILAYRSTGSSSSSSTGVYELHHPTLGPLRLDLHGQTSLLEHDPRHAYQRRQARPMASRSRASKIILVDPRHRRGNDGAGELASMDIAQNRVQLNVAALLSLGSPFMIDTAVCALVATAVVESYVAELSKHSQESYFAGPPTAPSAGHVRRAATDDGGAELGAPHSSTETGRRWTWGRSKGRAAGDAEPAHKLPWFVRGTLHLFGAALDLCLWVLGLGIRVLETLVRCVFGRGS